MTAMSMAEVLYHEGAWCGDCEYEGWDACSGCRDTCDGYARALTAAGFGLVADAKGEALREAAENILTNDPLDYWAGHLPEGLGFQEAMSHWLKAHAAVFNP